MLLNCQGNDLQYGAHGKVLVFINLLHPSLVRDPVRCLIVIDNSTFEPLVLCVPAITHTVRSLRIADMRNIGCGARARPFSLALYFFMGLVRRLFVPP